MLTLVCAVLAFLLSTIPEIWVDLWAACPNLLFWILIWIRDFYMGRFSSTVVGHNGLLELPRITA